MSDVNGALVWRQTTKSHQHRSVPFPRFLAGPLAAEVTGRGPGELLFPSRAGTALRVKNFRRDCFDPAALASDLQGLHPHELRHTAASLAVSAGANVKAVQHMLGHANASMTLDEYADLFPDDMDSVSEALERPGGKASRALRPLWGYPPPFTPEHPPVHNVRRSGRRSGEPGRGARKTPVDFSRTLGYRPLFTSGA